MSDAVGRFVVSAIGLLTVLCTVPIIAVQAIEAVHRMGSGDQFQPYRWATVSLFSLGALYVIWSELIWLDVTFNGAQLLGPTAMRWRLDLGIKIAALALAAYPAWVFWGDRPQSRRDARPRINTALLVALAMRGEDLP